jgi:periplasmic copper chaperone A
MRHLMTLATGLALLASPVLAHVTLGPDSGPAGADYFGAFRVPHGCKGSDTTGLRVEPPKGLSAKPQPKAGWTLSVEHGPPAASGRAPVTAFVWSGGDLPDDEFDTFGFTARLPATPGALVFKVTQTCKSGQETWDETPSAAAPHPTHPAPTLTVTPAGADDMGGMDMSGH